MLEVRASIPSIVYITNAPQQHQHQAAVALKTTMPHMEQSLAEDFAALEQLDLHLPLVQEELLCIGHVYDRGQIKVRPSETASESATRSCALGSGARRRPRMARQPAYDALEQNPIHRVCTRQLEGKSDLRACSTPPLRFTA